MPIIDCPCGKRLKVPEHAAGKLVRCPGCAESIRVRAEEEPAEAEPEKIRLSCEECDRTLAVPADYAGRKVRCPGCGAAYAPQSLPVSTQ